MAESQLLSVKKLKSLDILTKCLKHNLRQIPRELGENRHINPQRCLWCSYSPALVSGDPHLNYIFKQQTSG